MSNLKNVAIGAGVTVAVIGGVTYLLKMQRTTAELEVINQANLQAIKQQLLAQKKASNLLMKNLSPLKK